MLATLYLIALGLGGVLLLASFAGDVFDFDFGSDGHHHGDLGILTIRGVTYFLFVFGATGFALDRLAGFTPLAAALFATAAGLATAALVGRIFGYIRSTEAGDMQGDSTLLGLPAEVVVPLGARHEGKIAVRRGSERLELIARPFDEADGDPATWRAVRIIDVQNGTALVSPNQLLDA
jgi:hypothetical protein